MGSFQASIGTFVGDSGSGGQVGLVPAPASGDSGKFLKGSGAWATSTGGGGSKNYLAVVTTSNGTNTGNGDFELNATTGFSLAHSSLTSNFPSTVATATNSFSSAGGAHGGSAANVNLVQSIVSSSQLAGSYSYSYASSAATTAGDMVITDAFNIDTEDQAKVLTFKIYYKAQTNPSNANWSGTSSNSFGIAVYDVTNAAWIMPAGVWGMTQSSGVGYVTGTFQTTSNSTQYQLAVFNANATTGAVTLYLDDWSVGPQTAPFGSVMTDATSFTPTGSWSTNTTFTGWWSQRGDKLSMVVKLALAGAPTSASLTVNLPSGLTIDTTKLPATPTNQPLGIVTGQAAAHTFSGLAFYSSTTSIALNYTLDGSTASIMSYAAITQAAPYVFANNDFIYAYIDNIPIAGWSSNLQRSSDTDTRVVAMQVNGTPTATITGSDSLLKFTTTPTQDTHAAFSTSTGLYTVPVSGFYRVTANFDFTGSFTIDQGINISVRKNGTAINQNGWVSFGTTGAGYIALVNIAATLYCNAGDTLAPGTSGSGSSLSVTTSTLFNYFNVERLSGPAVIAATESVVAVYKNTAGTAIPNTTVTLVPWPTKVKDSHNAMNVNGNYTAPVSGSYLVSTNLTTTSNTVNTGAMNIRFEQNGSQVGQSGIIPIGNFTDTGCAGSYIMTGINAGDTIAVYLRHSNGASRNLLTDADLNNISITRIGS